MDIFLITTGCRCAFSPCGHSAPLLAGRATPTFGIQHKETKFTKYKIL